MDFSEEIRILEEKLENLEEDIYGNLKVWDVFKLLVMQNDRQRSIILSTYLLIFECHGDRLFGDDAAIVGGIAKYKGMPVTVIGHQREKIRKKIFAVTLECLIQKDIEKHCVS